MLFRPDNEVMSNSKDYYIKNLGLSKETFIPSPCKWCCFNLIMKKCLIIKTTILKICVLVKTYLFLAR